MAARTEAVASVEEPSALDSAVMPVQPSRESAPSSPYHWGTVSYYLDALGYDHTYKRRREDVQFYVDLCRESGNSVLELGAGTGRVSIPLAKAGISVAGVEIAESMLAQARRKSARLPRTAASLNWIQGDLTTVRLDRKFPLVLSPFNVWMHLYTREAFALAMETVRAHLAPGGLFVFDVLNPCPEALARDPERVFRGRKFKHPADGRFYHYAESFRYDALSQVQRIFIFTQPEGCPDEAETTEIAHRQYFPQELEALLYYNGFEVVERWGGFSREPLDEDSESQVLVTRLRPT